ncbi:ROK family protein [Paramicrobacterium chengjingii]|uniref:ROK family protein n=1 Tax=Paramicrobacterium chengjingii TaxID=2769067 RepID=UPI001424418B|nr:ROK family protein [Microbacterium chengjingii]
MTSSASAVIGVDVGGTKIAAALADSDGVVLAQFETQTGAHEGGAAVTERGLCLVSRLDQYATEAGLAVSGAAVAAAGVHKPGLSSFSPNVPGWDAASMVSEIGAELDLTVVPVWNDIHAAALAELRTGHLRDVDPGIYVGLGTGIASALCIAGTVIPGAHGAAGEIGFLNAGDGPSLGAEAGRATLEEHVGGKSIGVRASDLLGEKVDAADLFSRTDPASLHVLHHALGKLAAAVADIAVMIDPSRIVIGGGMMRSGDTILNVVKAQVRRQVPFPPEVGPAHHLYDASLHGAIQIALDQHRQNHRSSRQKQHVLTVES